ncbi:MAG: hypothetical protein RMJ98_10745, partial [Myxococcales bacterium]|nr:hypothetical protein [Polyangiaceae bacterium]MDW8249763.1 hypothetical protein [Myxococcales bacterium]
MAERRIHAPTAEQRLVERRRGLARARRERLLREVEGSVGRRLLDLLPIFFQHQGTLTAHALRSDRATVIEALRDEAVFALDTALRLVHGHGVLKGEDIHAYVGNTQVLARLGASGIIEEEPLADRVLVRAWPGPPRLLACVVGDMPPSRLI